MTTVQEPLAGPFSLPPCSLPNSKDRSKNSTNNTTDAAPTPQRCQFADPTRSGFGTPVESTGLQQPEIGVPSSGESHLQDELSPVNTVEPERGTPPQPSADRCQFSFSDGRQCRMPRTEHHAYLCAHHASKEELGCGAPALPELEALCGDLSTATNINRAVAQVFRLLAQGRISRRDALAFGSLGRLLLHTLPAIRRESIDAFGSSVYYDQIKSKLTALQPSPHDQRPPVNPGPTVLRAAAARPVAAPVNLPPPAPRSAPPPEHPIRKSEQGTPPLSTDRPTREDDALAARAYQQPPNKVESSPAAAPPGIAKPRFVWIERLQRLIPESSL